MVIDQITLSERSDNIDELTGLQNLNGVLTHLQGHDKYAGDDSSVIIYLNVMNFKSFNQTYGFAGGNEFIKVIAQELRQVFPDELLGRTGGDQFIILAKSLTEQDIQDRLAVFREAVKKYERALRMRIKAGVYFATGEEDDPVVMVDRAKMACDVVIRVYDKDYYLYDEALSKKNELKQYVIDNFEEAFRQRYFSVYYQKEVRAMTGKVCGYEALARWIDPERGVISPAVFVDVLESVHLINKLDLYIIDEVCKDIRDDLDSGGVVSPVSVNLSQLDFELCDIKADIDACREKYDIPVELIHIEITESAIASGSRLLDEQIKRFRDSGYQVWMDDFGAGYSSLNNLKSYDFDVLKIDMNFLRAFETNKKSRVIIATIVNMAKELGIHTLAEGVETKEQYDFLRRIGCEKLQGYYFGKPVPVEDFDRETDLTPEKCEDYRYSDYYDSIGAVNLLGPDPLRPITLEVFNNTPIAIVELEGSHDLFFLHANIAFTDLISSLGYTNTDDLCEHLNHPELAEVHDFVAALKNAEESEDRLSEIYITTNASVIYCKIRFLSRIGDKASFAVLTRNANRLNEKESFDGLFMAMTHILNQYFRVDLFDENGTVENVYLSANQLSVSDREGDSVKAVKLYADMYLMPEDRERFTRFYDITTVRNRVKESGGRYIVDYYRSAIPGDNGRMQMYMLLPFMYNNRWKYISCCRYADEIKDNSWK